jgi:hypothetical protein
MHGVPEPVLHPVAIAELRPTQITVGMREVEKKRKEFRERGAKGGKFLGTHMVPVVLGPKKRPYILDHHHLALALHRDGVEHVLTSVVQDLSTLDKDTFWFVLAHKNWMHVYDAKGALRTHKDIPKSVNDLEDDPYRSLAGELREAGGYAKDTAFYSEFLWADYLRSHIKPKDIAEDFDRALKTALDLARLRRASYLPGWCGPDSGA